MKKISTTVFLILLLLQLTAEAQQITFFEAENKLFFDASSFPPKSDLVFYNQRGAGKFMKRQTSTAAGKLQFFANRNFKPSVVGNVASPNALGISGNGKVYQLDQPEFSIQDIKITESAEYHTISWKAHGNLAEDVVFELERSTDGTEFETVGQLVAPQDTFERSYALDQSGSLSAALYRIRVTTAARGHRYTSSMLSHVSSGALVFPTVSSSEVNLIITKDWIGSEYKIVNQQGQLVKRGSLPTEKTTISVSEFATGTYHLILSGKQGTKACRFIKS